MSNAELKARPVWVTNGRRSAVIAMLGSTLRMLQFRLWHGWAFPWNETGGLQADVGKNPAIVKH